MTPRAEYVLIAKVAEEAERFDGEELIHTQIPSSTFRRATLDVVSQIKSMIYIYDARLTIEERNLLSVAYKNITNDLRNSWRIIESLETLEASRAKSRRLALIRMERIRIEKELANVCKDVVKVCDTFFPGGTVIRSVLNPVLIRRR